MTGVIGEGVLDDGEPEWFAEEASNCIGNAELVEVVCDTHDWVLPDKAALGAGSVD